MTEGNGKAVGGMMAPPTETVPFRIGGTDVQVPILTLYVLDRMKDLIFGLGPEIDFIEREKRILTIIRFSIEAAGREIGTEEELLRNCTAKEGMELIATFNKLLNASGFDIPDPEQSPATAGSSEAEQKQTSPGTGTSTPSQPDLPLTASASVTSTG